MRSTEKGFHFPEVTASIDFFFLIIQYFKWGESRSLGKFPPEEQDWITNQLPSTQVHCVLVSRLPKLPANVTQFSLSQM